MTRQIENIVVGVASLDSDPVLHAAGELAQRLNAMLHVVHAYDLPQPILAAYARAGLLEPEVVERYGSSLRGDVERAVGRLAVAEHARCRTVSGSASRALCAAVEEVGADLVVVGATRQGPVMRHILGSTADQVIRSAGAPVLVLRPPYDTTVTRVLLTTDLSALSAEAVEEGIELAGTLAAPDTPELRCLLVSWYDAALPPPLHRDSLEQVAAGELRRFLAERRLHGRAVEPRVRIGDPPKEIVTESADWMADLVVVGTRGQEGVSRYLLGSVAASVLRSAMGNVLVIPGSGLAEPTGDRGTTAASAGVEESAQLPG